MLPSMDNAHIRAYFLAIVTTLLTILAVYMLRPFLVTIGLAAVFAVIFTPLHGKLKQLRFPDSLAALCTLLIGIVVVAVPLVFLCIQLFQEVESVYFSVSQPGTVTHAQGALVAFGDSLNGRIPGASEYFTSVASNLGDYARRGLSWTLGYAGAFFTGTLTFILHLFVFLMTLYYLLKEGPRLTRAIERFSPLTKAETDALVARLTYTIASVVRGSLFVALIQGALTAVGFLVFGIPNALLWGTLAVVASLIPSVGTGFVFIPAVIYLFFTGHSGNGIGLAVYGIFFVGLVDNFLRPYLMGGKASIHPLLILLSVLGGLAFFGPGGLFLGPLVISLLLGLLSLYAPARNDTR